LYDAVVLANLANTAYDTHLPNLHTSIVLRFCPTMPTEFARVRLRAFLLGEVLSIALSQEGSIFHTKALRYGPARAAFHSVPSLALLIRLSLSALAALRAVSMP